MVQVLPYVPTFGEKLLPVLSQAGSDISQGLVRRQAQTALQKLLTPQQNAGQSSQAGASPMQNMMNQTGSQGMGGSLGSVIGTYNILEQALGTEAAKVGIQSVLAENKENRRESAEIRKEERGLEREADKSFFEKVSTDRVKIQDEQLASDMILDAVKSGEIDPFSSAHIADIAKSFGAPETLTNILQTPGSKEFQTARKTFIGNTVKDAFRGTTTKIEINLAEEMLSQIGVTKEGNLASAFGLQAGLDIKKERIRLTDQLRDEGVPASKIPRTVDKMMEPFILETKKEYFEALKELKKRSKNG